MNIKYMDRNSDEERYFTDICIDGPKDAVVQRFWMYDENFMNPDLCDAVVEEVEKNKISMIKGGGIHVPEGDTQYRNSDITFLSNMENDIYREARDHIVAGTMLMNEKIFNFDLTHLMHIQYTRYNDQNQHFNWHSDGPLGIEVAHDLDISGNVAYRKLSTVVCLSNHEDYDGGEFLLFDAMSVPEHAICVFKMNKGEAIHFPAFALHRVMPVTRGLRTSLVNWFCGPRWT